MPLRLLAIFCVYCLRSVSLGSSLEERQDSLRKYCSRVPLTGGGVPFQVCWRQQTLTTNSSTAIISIILLLSHKTPHRNLLTLFIIGEFKATNI